MAKIIFVNKDKTGNSPVNKWRDADANEAKASINAIYDMMNTGAFAALTAQATTNITASDTYTPIAGTFSNTPANGFEDVADPGIKYTGTKTMYFEIDLYSSFSTPSNNSTVTFAIKKNGTTVDHSQMTAFAKSLGETYNLSSTAVIELETDDVIQLVIKTDTGADVTFNNITTSIRPFILPLT